MAPLTSDQRDSLPASMFALPANKPGSGSYPIPDVTHARNALSRASQNASPADKTKVRRAVRSKYPQINQGSPLAAAMGSRKPR